MSADYSIRGLYLIQMKSSKMTRFCVDTLRRGQKQAVLIGGGNCEMMKLRYLKTTKLVNWKTPYDWQLVAL